MKSDIEIARETPLLKIKEVANRIGIPKEDVQNYGKYMAKLPLHLIDEEQVRQHNLILVTAITPTITDMINPFAGIIKNTTLKINI